MESKKRKKPKNIKTNEITISTKCENLKGRNLFKKTFNNLEPSRGKIGRRLKISKKKL